MADKENTKSGPPRIALGDYKSARHSLSRFIRQYFRRELDTEHFRTLCYGLNILLSFDKHERDCEIDKRLTALEQKTGNFNITISADEFAGICDENMNLKQSVVGTETAAELKPAPAVEGLLSNPMEAEKPMTKPQRLKL
jgi:hypothetical protein